MNPTAQGGVRGKPVLPVSLCLLVAVALPLSARSAVDSLDEFARIPVLENGRKMPLDTYARQKLLQMSGRS